MARARRDWTALLAAIRALLRETTAATSYWSDALLLELFNAQIDLRCAYLHSLEQEWLVETSLLSLIAGQDAYQLGEGFGGSNITRVDRLIDLGGGRIATVQLRPDSEFFVPSVSGPGIGATSVSYIPTYRFRADWVVLSPTPQFSESNAIRFTANVLPARIAAGTDKIDRALPSSTEALLIYDTVLAALSIEGTQGPPPEDGFGFDLVLQRDALERAWKAVVEVKVRVPQSNVGMDLGG